MCKMAVITINDKTIRVAEIKIPAIRNAVEKISKLKFIDRAILFGSALTNDCTEDSDIDIAMFGSIYNSQYLKRKDVARFFHELLNGTEKSESYDILYFRNDQIHTDSLIMNEIRTKGTEIYAVQ